MSSLIYHVVLQLRGHLVHSNDILAYNKITIVGNVICIPMLQSFDITIYIWLEIQVNGNTSFLCLVGYNNQHAKVLKFSKYP